MAKPDYIQAHKHSAQHETELGMSYLCGCFYCLHIFKPSEINDWVDETNTERTALCPACHIDSVIGSQSGFPITLEFLTRMQKHWFSFPGKTSGQNK